MTVKCTRRISLDKFKASKNTEKILVCKSKKTEKLYATTAEGDFIGMLTEDFDKSKDIYILTFVDQETGDTWDCLGNYTPSQMEYTL